jgi:hypothetical protein
MQKVTTLTLIFAFFGIGSLFGQVTELAWDVPLSEELSDPYPLGIHSGARSIAGPFDLDGDGLQEIIVSDYTGGGRVHVIENASVDTWELVYTSPVLDSTSSTGNIRVIAGGDLDGDGHGEFMFLSGCRLTSAPCSDSLFADENLPQGLYVFEHTGTDNDYGSGPASIYDFGDDPPDRFQAEQMIVADVDNDGVQEVMFGNNGSSNRYDNWYILSILEGGDIGSGFEVWVEEARFSTRASEDFDPVDRGGGSAYGIIPADLNGDGIMEIAFQSWNSYNFTNVSR